MSHPRFAVGGERSSFASISLMATAAVTLVAAVVSMLTATGLLMMLFVIDDVLQLIAICAFGVWLHRAYANLAALRNPSRYSPATAVSFFFLPLVSFFLPQAILQEIWTKSAALDPRARSGPPPEPAAPWFEWWWYVFILASAAFNYAVTKMIHAPDFVQGVTTTPLVLAALLSIVSAVIGSNIIRSVDVRQKAAFLVTSLPGFAPPAASAERSAVRDLLMPIVTMSEEDDQGATDDSAGS